jgi:hypothetical protein
MRESGAALSAIYGGDGSNLRFLRDTFFASAASRTLIERVPPFALGQRLERLAVDADLLMCERAPLWASLGKRIGTLRMPAWIKQELQLGAAGARWLLPRHIEREADRQVRRHGYRLELSTGAADLSDFYTRFYSPYVKSRFADEAVVVDHAQFQRVAAGQTLAKLYATDEWVAGMLLQRSSRSIRFGWFGSTSTPPPPGASEALDVLCIRMAAQNGVRRVVLGHSRPSLADGVVRYKQKFGAHVRKTRFPQSVLELKMLRSNRALAEWICSRQFVCLQQSGLAVLDCKSSADRLEGAMKSLPADKPSIAS